MIPKYIEQRFMCENEHRWEVTISGSDNPWKTKDDTFCPYCGEKPVMFTDRTGKIYYERGFNIKKLKEWGVI